MTSRIAFLTLMLTSPAAFSLAAGAPPPAAPVTAQSAAGAPPPAAPVTAQSTAIIIHTGSTNRPGHLLFVSSSGKVRFKVVRGRGTPAVVDAGTTDAAVPADLVAKLFADIAAAGPLGSLPAQHCPKSRSFGSSYFIEQNGVRSPDLDCPGDPPVNNLKADILSILKSLPSARPR